MMARRSVSYKEFLHQDLRNNTEAANYLQAALEDSQTAFLIALKNVLDARKQTAASHRHAKSPKPGPAVRCFPGGPESARGHTSVSSESLPDFRRLHAPPPNGCRGPPGPRCCPLFRKSYLKRYRSPLRLDPRG